MNIKHDLYFDVSYKKLVKDILNNGVIKSDRTGTGTISLFGKILEHDMKTGFPMLTLRKIHFNNVITELLWFLKGRTDLRYLLENGNKIWVGDCFKRFLKINPDSNFSKEKFIDEILNDDDFSNEYGDCGPIYGKQWRNLAIYKDKKINNEPDKIFLENKKVAFDYIDQIQILIEDLKSNPDSRRLMVNSWNLSDFSEMLLPPCHYVFQCYTTKLTAKERVAYYDSGVHGKNILEIYLHINEKESDNNHVHEWLDKFASFVPTRKLSLMFNMRSCDVPLGLPTNMASYAILLELLALETNMICDKLIVNIGDAHIYLNQIEQMKELIERESFELPELKINKKENSDFLRSYEKTDFELMNYKHGQFIKIPLSN